MTAIEVVTILNMSPRYEWEDIIREYGENIIDQCADYATIDWQGGTNTAGDWQEDYYVSKPSIYKVKTLI